jgi:hypothetical protein
VSLQGFSQQELRVICRLPAEDLSGDSLRIAACNFSDEPHESKLVVTGFLGTDIMFAEEVLPPLLTLLPQVPFLQVVNQSKVVMLGRFDCRKHATQSAPEGGRSGDGCSYAHD